MPKYVVATVAEIPPGKRKVVDVAGRSIGIFNLGGELFALRNRCPHQGGPLCEGRQSGFLVSEEPGDYHYSRPGEIIRCPWHGWEFDIRTGQSWFDPRGVRVRRYPVEVAPGADVGGAPASTVEPAEAPVNPGDVRADAEMAGLEKGPYVAESYPVSIEQRHVLVEIDA